MNVISKYMNDNKKTWLDVLKFLSLHEEQIHELTEKKKLFVLKTGREFNEFFKKLKKSNS